MGEYKDVIKALANKLQRDRSNTELEDGSENLNYIMEARLQQDIMDELMGFGTAEFPEAVEISSIIATKYMDWLINLNNI